MGFDPRDFDAMQARTEAARGVRRSPMLRAHPAVEEEADLHYEIIDLCNSKGWGYIHSRMDKRSTSTEGAPDFVILADGSRVFFFECKDREGKLSLKQQGFIAQAKRNGHTVHVVRSKEEVFEIVYEQKKLI